MTTIAETYARALQHQRAGDLAQAEWLCRQVLAANPAHDQAANTLGIVLAMLARLDEAVANFRLAVNANPANAAYHSNLGNVLSALGQHDAAAASHRQSLKLNPKSAATHNNLGSVLFGQDKFQEALDCFQTALRLAPDYPEAQNNLGSALERLNQLDDAIGAYRQAIKLKPAYAEAWYNLGNVLQRQEKMDEALRCYQEALRLRPDYPEAFNNMATIQCGRERYHEALDCSRQALRLRPNYPEALNNLASAWCGLECFDEAAQSCRESLRLRPEYAEAHNNLGVIFARQKKPEEAMPYYQEALRLKPDYADAHNNMGSAFERLDQFDEALACYREAVRLNPKNADAISNLGMIASRRNNLDEALRHYEAALLQKPELSIARWNRALLYLLLGDFERGWAEYEWRWTQPGFGKCQFAQPRWDGSRLDGRTILLFAEQGLGDTLQFARYAPRLQALGGKVVLECQPALLRLLAGTKGIDTLVAQGDTLPPFDVYAPLLSVPGIFQTTHASIPADVPYVYAEAALVESWRQILPPRGASSLRIGITWQGNPANMMDRQRSIPLSFFARLATQRLELISLQYGFGVEQLKATGERMPILDLADRLGDQSASLSNIAAILKNVDLAICCDTAVAHLAGALGVPVWLALPLVPDWRWLLHRDDSTWYPTMRLFRQTQLGEWDDVFERMTHELAKMT